MEEVIVVGAGVSGLAAAWKIHRKGAKVTILEGRDRIGGRLFTERETFGVPVDMGAQWIHVLKGNPTHDIAKELGLNLVPTDWENGYFPIRTKKGKIVDLKDHVGEETYEEWVEAANEIVEEQIFKFKKRISEDKPVEFAKKKYLEKALEEADGGELAELTMLWWLYLLLDADYGEDPQRLSLKFIGEDEEFEGDESTFPHGYDQILPYFLPESGELSAKGYKIELSTTVTKIEYDRGDSDDDEDDEEGKKEKMKKEKKNKKKKKKKAKKAVRVTSEDGRVWEADAVVVTVPVGVLKKSVEEEGATSAIEFIPALPKAKRKAIQGLGMGAFSKLAMEFEECFWPKDAVLLGNLKGAKSQEKFPYFFSLLPATGKPILLAHFVAEFARRDIEDEVLLKMALDTLASLFGFDGKSAKEPKMPKLLRWNIKKWHVDPFAYGCYSHIPVGSPYSARDALAEPIGETLFFAGEATASDYPATIHGAYLSGMRAAKSIVDLMED